MAVTASMLYDLVACPHRVGQDLFGDPKHRDPVSPFIELLWERGSAVEAKTIGSLSVPYLDLKAIPVAERAQRTAEAMAAGVPLIYGGRLEVDDLVGEPDLLRRQGDRYIPIDIKSGSGEEGGDEDERKPKKHYAVQVALYVDALERLSLSAGRVALIWDVHGAEVAYDLNAAQGVKTPETWWEFYQRTLAQAKAIITRAEATSPAYSSTCKLCHWHSACLAGLKDADDLTLIPDLGRSKRHALEREIQTVSALAKIDPAAYVTKKKTAFPGIGPGTLHKLQRRAALVKGPDPSPYLTAPITFPEQAVEVFFDIEVDPMRDLCYLHGFVERSNRDNGTERYLSFFLDETTEASEEKAFADAWSYLSLRRPCVTYYYSKYERTWWRKLQEKYPHICSREEVDAIFEPTVSVDLYYDVVKPSTEWPTIDHSIKTLAKLLGFRWRDTDPSGAASIQWFDEWTKTRKDEDKRRILEYNEDDCRATRVLLDGIRRLPIRAP